MTDSAVRLLDANGQPMTQPQRRASMLAGGARAPYDAADIQDQHMRAWWPYLWSPDGELNMYRDRIVARVRDMVRNDGWASGAITRILDNAVGANFRPAPKPDHRALAAYTGMAAFDDVWAAEFGKAIEAGWRTWGSDLGRYCDTQRRLTAGQMFCLAFRHKLVDGDALAVMHWRPGYVGPGRAHYATAMQLIDPDRLSNPQLRFDQQTMRGGVEVDEWGAAVGYWIRRAHQGDWFSAAESVHWDLIPRETDWGRPIVVHDFDYHRAGEHRGGAGVLAPVLQRLKMLVKYDGAELDAAIINAIFAAYIESPFDQDLVAEAMGAGGFNQQGIGAYQTARSEYHKDRNILLGGSRIPILFPGEKINAVGATRPAAQYADFENAVLRHVSAAAGLSAQQVSNNWSDVNYSSARGALLEAWKTLTRRRFDFGIGFCTQVYACLIEEMMDLGELPLPNGAPDFMEARTAYARCVWIGPGRGWIDPVAEKQGAVLGMDAGLSTLEAEAAENVGADWEDLLDQRAREVEGFKARGLPVPTWAGMQTATEAAQKPKQPEAV